MIEGEFEGTSYKLSNSEDLPKGLNLYLEGDEIYNNSSLLFLEEEYIEQERYFTKIVDKFKKKIFDSNLRIFQEDRVVPVDDYSQDAQLYSSVIHENNINGLKKSELKISIRHFDEYKCSEKIKYVQELYILLFLADITEFSNNEFIFKVKINEKESQKRCNFHTVVNLDLVEVYEWITTNTENLNTRLKIVREIILKNESFDLKKTDFEAAKSIFNRIIKEETDKYFTQVNVLKDDFLRLSERKRKSYASLHVKLISWFGSLGLFAYGELKNIPNGKIVNKLFFSLNEKVYVFSIIFLISLLIIAAFFLMENQENIKEYEKISDLYTKHLFFEKSDFNNYVESPKVKKIDELVFIALIVIIMLRVFYKCIGNLFIYLMIRFGGRILLFLM